MSWPQGCGENTRTSRADDGTLSGTPISFRQGSRTASSPCWTTSCSFRLRRWSITDGCRSGCPQQTTRTRRSRCRHTPTSRSSPSAHKSSTNVRCLPDLIFSCGFCDLANWIGSRRLITYRRIPDKEVDPEAMKAREEMKPVGITADELNPFRKAYFSKFEPVDGGSDDAS